jgi:hypothetical protein
MKRLITGMAAATLMAGGLLGVSAESANAECPYTGCVPTSTTVTVPNAPVAQGGKAKICVKVSTSGSGKAKGRVGVVVKKRSGGSVFTDSKRYDGRTCFTTGNLDKPGRYLVRASFQAAASSAFGDSDNATAFNVKR